MGSGASLIVGRWLTIVGIGAEGVDGLSPAARAHVADASLVVGGARHLALADALIAGERIAWSRPLSDTIDRIVALRGHRVVVLASGDPSWFGVATALAARVDPQETLCLPVASAFSLACARLGWAVQDVQTLSFCGRPVALPATLLQQGVRVLALSESGATPRAVASLLVDRGYGPSALHVLESLGAAGERVRRTTASEFDMNDVGALNVVAVELASAPGAPVAGLACGLDDRLFDHDGQITKSPIRAVTLAALSPRRGALLWDIGCGSGSVGIEWMLCDPSTATIGIEADPVRAARAAANASALGVPGWQGVTGRAPAALDGLPPPDAVFVGGGASDPTVLEAAWTALVPGGRLVANAVTVETEAALHAARARWGGALVRLSVDRLDGIGRMHAWRPAMAVTQFCVVKA